jgi:hypothetical protein
MSGKARINATPEQRALRNVTRILTLRKAIEKAKTRGQKDRVGSLKSELDRRLVEVRELRAALESIDA